MNIENKVDEILKTTAWFNQQTIQKKDSDRQKLKIQAQHIFHEISLIRYFSYNTDSDNFGHSDVSYKEIIAAFIQHEPLRLHSKLSPNISQFITQWVFDFANRPKMFAEGVIKTLSNNPIDSGIFIYVTFPSMFYHFQTDEYLNLAVVFLEEIIQKAPKNISISFVSAFLLCAAKFVKSLWNIFDELVDKRSPIRTYSDYYVIFIEALKTSSLALTKQHVHIIKFFKQFNLENFAKCLISNFLNITYDESHLSKIHDESRQLIKFFKYAEKNPTSHHFAKIYNALIPKVGTFWVPFNSDLIETRIPLVMNCHEFFLIQQIAKDNPTISNLKYIQYLTVPKKVYMDFCPVYFDVAFPLPPSKINDQLGSLIFSNKFYESEIKNFIVEHAVKNINEDNSAKSSESNINANNNNNNASSSENSNSAIETVSTSSANSAENQLLQRKWRQITAYARTKNIHPLSLFSSKIVTDRSFDELNNLNFRQDSPLFEYAVKDVYSESLKVHSQFEVLVNRLLLCDFLKELLHLLFFTLKVVLQKFTMRLICTDRIFDNYHLNSLIGAKKYNTQFANFAVARFADHFDAGSNAKRTFRLAFLPSQMKRERVRKMIVDNELYDIFLIGINRKKSEEAGEAASKAKNEAGVATKNETIAAPSQNAASNAAPNSPPNAASSNLSHASQPSHQSPALNAAPSQNAASNAAPNSPPNAASSNPSHASQPSHQSTALNAAPSPLPAKVGSPNPPHFHVASSVTNSPHFNVASSVPNPPHLAGIPQPAAHPNLPSRYVTHVQSPPQNPYSKQQNQREVPPRSSSFGALNQAKNSPTLSQTQSAAAAVPKKPHLAPGRAGSHESSSTETENGASATPTSSLRKRRRHSQHAIQFIHTSSEFFVSVNRVLKSRGRTNSPLEICMISKIIDEWRISYFDGSESTRNSSGDNLVTKSFSDGNRNRQIHRNGEVGEFIISSLQKRFTSHIELWKTKRKMGKVDESASESSFDELKPALKYILFVAKEIDAVNNIKKGAAIFQLIRVGTLIDQISFKISSEKKRGAAEKSGLVDPDERSRIQFLVFECCLLMSKSGGLFETFMLYEKLSADIIGFNTSIPLNVMKPVLIVARCFWKILKKLDNELYESCIHFVDHVQYSFTI